jgi:hypothetical protein
MCALAGESQTYVGWGGRSARSVSAVYNRSEGRYSCSLPGRSRRCWREAVHYKVSVAYQLIHSLVAIYNPPAHSFTRCAIQSSKRPPSSKSLSQPAAESSIQCAHKTQQCLNNVKSMLCCSTVPPHHSRASAIQTHMSSASQLALAMYNARTASVPAATPRCWPHAATVSVPRTLARATELTQQQSRCRARSRAPRQPPRACQSTHH